MSGQSTIHAGIDYECYGKQVGNLFLPQSPHEDAWGAIAIPIAVLRNGSGPTVLITGGNHGDEYEGPIAIARLIRELDPGAVQGRLILLPQLNLPALAGRRISPVDGKNFNRPRAARMPGTPQTPWAASLPPATPQAPCRNHRRMPSRDEGSCSSP
jgi:predicted deacylase